MMQLKEIDLDGVFLAPFVGYLAVALVIFLVVRRIFDRYAIQKWVWHRPLFDISVFVIILSVIGLMF